MSVRQLVAPANICEGRVRVGADVPSMREKQATPFGLCSGTRLLATVQEGRFSPSGDVLL